MDTSAQKIKKLMIDHKVDSIAQLAREYQQKTKTPCSREQMSMCINGQRDYPGMREFLAKRFSKTVDQLFGVRKAA